MKKRLPVEQLTTFLIQNAYGTMCSACIFIWPKQSFNLVLGEVRVGSWLELASSNRLQISLGAGARLTELERVGMQASGKDPTWISSLNRFGFMYAVAEYYSAFCFSLGSIILFSYYFEQGKPNGSAHSLMLSGPSQNKINIKAKEQIAKQATNSPLPPPPPPPVGICKKLAWKQYRNTTIFVFSKHLLFVVQ